MCSASPMITGMLCSMTSRRQAALFIGCLEPIDQAVDQHRIDAGGRLIEQQQLGIVDQRHGQLEQLLLAEGEVARERVALGGKPDEVEQLGAARRGVLRRAAEQRRQRTSA